MLESIEESSGAIRLRWLVLALAFGLVVLLPLFSADSEGSLFGLPLDVVLTTGLVPLALVVLSFWYERRAAQRSGRT